MAVLSYAVVAFNLAFSAAGAIPGLEYVPGNKGLWLGCVAALLLAALGLDAWRGRRSGRWLPLLPVLAVAVLRLFAPAEGMGMWQCLLALLDLILGGVLLARARSGGIGKQVTAVISVLVLIPTLQMMLFTALFGTGGIILHSYPNPTGNCEAEVRVGDEGALGGRVTVTVFRDPLPLPFGTLRHVEGQCRMGWIDPDALLVEWTDEDSIAINGEVWNWRE